MSSDYPTNAEIDKVKSWTFEQPGSFEAFMEYVRSIGHYWPWDDPVGWTQECRIYRISTGGWSGNEEILSAMEANWMFWSVCWRLSRRGGHFEFELPDPEKFFRKSSAAPHNAQEAEHE